MGKFVFCLVLLTALTAVHAAEEHAGTYSEDSITRGARIYYGTARPATARTAMRYRR